MRVMVTGGRGTFGRLLTPLLLAAGHEVILTSRSGGPTPEGTEGRILDLSRDRLPAGVLEGVDTIIHAASNAARPISVDVRGTALLMEAGERAEVGHLIYPSIVGVDNHPFAYYRAKAAAESRVEGGGVPFTILRATQFHEFLDRIFGTGPFIAVFPRFDFQVIDGAFVADRVVELVQAGPQGRVADLGGPRAERMHRMATTWKRATASPRPIIPLPVFGRTPRAFRQRRHHTPNVAAGSRTWDAWLVDTYPPGL
jgi:uncharacterized protein YbjT (DUF2867 family)